MSENPELIADYTEESLASALESGSFISPVLKNYSENVLHLYMFVSTGSLLTEGGMKVISGYKVIRVNVDKRSL